MKDHGKRELRYIQIAFIMINHEIYSGPRGKGGHLGYKEKYRGVRTNALEILEKANGL